MDVKIILTKKWMKAVRSNFDYLYITTTIAIVQSKHLASEKSAHNILSAVQCFNCKQLTNFNNILMFFIYQTFDSKSNIFSAFT